MNMSLKAFAAACALAASGIVPFPIAPLILIALVFLFPGISLWLPKVLYG